MNDPESNSVEENLAIVNFITLQRCYDVLSLILKNTNPKDWEQLMTLHEDGDFATPAPSLRTESEDNDE